MPKLSRLDKCHLNNLVPSVGANLWHKSNITKLSRSSGKISLNCDNCGLGFDTYACWAKKYATHFCSRGCASKFREIKKQKKCVICGAEFFVVLNRVNVKTTCSNKCRTIRKAQIVKDRNASGNPLHRWPNDYRLSPQPLSCKPRERD